jgi:hypothetical protein
MPITGWTSKSPANAGMARNALEALHKHYPMHSWFVRIDGGVIVIYNYAIDGRHGMVRHLSQIQGDDTTFVKSVVRAAGELLERARLRRAARQAGVVVREVDGIDRRKRRPVELLPLEYY